jgi:hypothetical protein
MEAEEMEMVVVVVEMVEVIEMAAVTITTVAMMVNAVAAVMTTAKTVAVVVTDEKRRWQMAYQRELCRIISGSEVRFMCNITSLGYLNNDRPW